jgi:conjugative relaxase-like TrwC/TraI family protein
MVASTKIFRPMGDIRRAINETANYYFSYLKCVNPGLTFAQVEPQWRGSGSKALGLMTDTLVTKEAVKNMMLGLSPDGTKELYHVNLDGNGDSPSVSQPDDEKKDRCKHVPAVDVCLSVAKSITLFWLMSPPSIRQIVIDCILKAADRFIENLETEGVLVRRGKGGVDKQKANLVISSFLHSMSRENEPQLHLHLLMMALCQSFVDGEWSKLDTLGLLKLVPKLASLFNNDLLANLYEKLGLTAYRPPSHRAERALRLIEQIKPTKRSENYLKRLGVIAQEKAPWFELTGVSQDLCREFSTRRKQIENEVEVEGTHSSSWAARQAANLKTRQEKEDTVTLEEAAAIENDWRAVAAEFGFTQEKALELVGKTIEFSLEKELDEAVKKALSKITDSLSSFDRLTLLKHVSDELLHLPIESKLIQERVTVELSQSTEIVQLTNDQSPLYTTRAMAELEKQMLVEANILHAKPGPKIDDFTIGTVLQSRQDFIPEQRQVFIELSKLEGSLGILSGVAGAGKSYLMEGCCEALQKAGYEVVCLAVGADISRRFGDQLNVPSYTFSQLEYHFNKSNGQVVADLLSHARKATVEAFTGRDLTSRSNEPKLDKKTVIMVDELSQVGTRQMQFLTSLAVSTGCSLMLLGDTSQRAAIEAGNPFGRLIQEYGSSELKESFRQRHDADRKLATLVREGEIDKAIEDLVSRNRLYVYETREDAIRGLVQEWFKDGNGLDPSKSLILTYTNAEADFVNKECQRVRLDNNLLAPKSMTIGNTKFYINDYISFRENMRDLGVLNGTTAKISDISILRRTITFELDRPKEKEFFFDSPNKLITIKMEDLHQGNIALGYAATDSRKQGATSDLVYSLLGGREACQEATYVQATRAREATQFFIDSSHAGEDFEIIARAIRRSEKKHLAHDVDQRHEIELKLDL